MIYALLFILVTVNLILMELCCCVVAAEELLLLRRSLSMLAKGWSFLLQDVSCDDCLGESV